MQPLALLLVEDSPLDAELTIARLEKDGVLCDVHRVQTRAELEQALDARPFDLILSDYSLPQFSGAEALEIARRKASDTPFIFVSGVLGEQVAIDTLKEGATDYILKHRLDRLAPAIRRALAERQERTERQKAEAALRLSEQRYRLLTEAMPQLVWTMDLNGRIDYCNDYFTRYTGISADEIRQRGWAEALHQDDREKAMAQVDAARQTGGGLQFEYRFCYAAEDSHRWHLGRIVPVRDESNRISQWLGTAVDIDSQKQAEESLLRSNEELQQFAFAASHDLQEPLRTVVSYTQLLARKLSGKLDADTQDYIRFAVDAAKRMSTLIEDLLEYTQVTRQDQSPMRTVEVRDAVTVAVANLRSVIEESGAEVVIETLPSLCGDAAQLSQLFQNLIGNSIKYRDPGRKPKIEIGSKRLDGAWLFWVKDNGQGFEQHYSDRIFTIFKRLHNIHVSGTGIGLAICKRVVERHGGKIWAESQPGQGATFFFTIPDRSQPDQPQDETVKNDSAG